jgi:hypothetical protein
VPCYSPLKGWKSLNNGGLTFDRSEAAEKMEVACGQCVGCRADRGRHWAMRIVHESSVHEFDSGNCFVTLTYRSKEECSQEQLDNGYHVPSDWSLHESHVQKFLKRLRKANAHQKIRYYYCGEYGRICRHNYDVEVFKHDCKTGRPHYHLCLFNWRPPDGQLIGPDLYDSPYLDSIWKYGFTSYGDITYQSAAYVSRYVLKKLTGAMAADKYLQFNEDVGHDIWLTPEYARMSLKPGIGKRWLDDYSDDVFRSPGGTPVPGEGNVFAVPRYYDKILEEVDAELFEKVKLQRKKFLSENKEEYSPERLMAKYKVHMANQKLFGKRDVL